MRVAQPYAGVRLPAAALRRPAGPARRLCNPRCEAAPGGPAPAASSSNAPAKPKAQAQAAPIAPAAIPGSAAAQLEAAAVESADLKRVLQRAQAAQREYSSFTQEQVDAIFKAAAFAANNARLPLAKMAVAETGMGVVEDKVIKGHFASEFVYHKYKDTKTVGVVERDVSGGMTKVAEPVGVIAGIVPTTNPTSTAVFKALLALKTRNAIVFCPHPRAKKSTIEAARIVHDAAVEAGAPAGIISWIENPSMAISQQLMRSPEINLIVATGGPAMVRAAYSSGHPSIGVGAGNTPAVIDETANVQSAVSSVLISKTFDNGVICASEQSVVVVDKVYEEVKAEFVRRGAYFLTKEDLEKVRKLVIVDGKLNANIVGQSVQRLAEIFGIKVPRGTKVLIGEVAVIGHEEPLSEEKLCPLLAMYRAPSFEEAVEMADRLIRFAGPGHTSVLYTNPLNKAHITHFGDVIKTVRVLINAPASQGAIGDLYNFHLDPSLTLGCGSWGETSVSTQVGPNQMLNFKSVTERRENMLWFRVPQKVYFKPGCLETALGDIRGKKRAFIVTDKPLFDLGYADKVTHILDDLKIAHQIFYRVEPDPTLACIKEGLKDMLAFQPDVIIAIGGGSPMDAAKIMWLMYEQADVEFEGLALRFMDIRKRVYDVPALGVKADMVAIPTTSGTGSEVTPFSVVTDEATGQKYPLADYALTPTIAIVDPQLVLNQPKRLTAWAGVDALTHALESYVSIFATDYTMGLSKEAVKLLFKYLPRAYHNGPQDLEAREKVHYASTIAGMAFANAFLGICHSMAHKLGAAYHVPHGLSNAALISHVIRYNATDAPFKMGTLPQYEYPQAKERYAAIADELQLGGNTLDEKVIKLIEAVEALKKELDIPATLTDIIGKEKEEAFLASLNHLAEEAFDDQCTGANPRYPLISDLSQILQDAWTGPVLPLKSLDTPWWKN